MLAPFGDGRMERRPPKTAAGARSTTQRHVWGTPLGTLCWRYFLSVFVFVFVSLFGFASDFVSGFASGFAI